MPTSNPIVTAAEMAAAEEAVIESGTSVEELMERAGKAVADYVWRIAGAKSVLVLCGPGNNGGDGYVVARLLSDRGCDVRVAALADPVTDAALAARKKWKGDIGSIEDAAHAAILVDALFGTGLKRPLDAPLAKRLCDLAEASHHAVAVDLPSGVETDSAKLLSPIPDYAMTVALGALKPAHMLQPAAHYLGEVVLGEIGIPVESDLFALDRPRIEAPSPDDHKYSRGYVLVAGGPMAGAATLASEAALRSGAGYVTLAGPEHGPGPLALVRRMATEARTLGELLADQRIDVAAIGPGLGLNDKAEARLDHVLDSDAQLVLDADALTLIAKRGLTTISDRTKPPVLTPHEGEFGRLFGELAGSKIDRARRAAELSGSVVVYKGSDTVIAAPDGRAAVAPIAAAWLASAGTGDVLTGIVAARCAATGDPFRGACEAVWLHGEAARRAGPFLVADDLLARLPETLAVCL